nr:M14 family zinc carboxypeptidase [Candidatus Sigynarchaeum springense]
MRTRGHEGRPAITVDGDFPGGNIIVEKIRGTRIRVHQDPRDTDGFWFYWCFRARGAAGRRIRVTFTGGRVFGPRGPAWSGDGGNTWAWTSKAATRLGTFTFLVPDGATEARFCFAVPYTEADLARFLSCHAESTFLSVKTLCETRKGRRAEMLLAGALDKTPLYRVVVTARHHACESVASFVVEGLLEHVLGEDPDGDGAWFRDRVSFMVIPFVDKDGVEDGDQGKNRLPRDHNRDYDDRSLHPTVKAIKELVPAWLAGVKTAALDLHCPYIHDERIQMIGLPDERQWAAVEAFSSALESVQRGTLRFHAKDNIPFGQAWNTARNTGKGLSFCSWAWKLPGMLLAATIEIPYATASGSEVNACTARSLGHDIARAMRAFLERHATDR